MSHSNNPILRDNLAWLNAVNEAKARSGDTLLPVPELPTDADEAALDAMAERVARKLIEAQAEAGISEESE